VAGWSCATSGVATRAAARTNEGIADMERRERMVDPE
jgi:hypothetical protein